MKGKMVLFNFRIPEKEKRQLEVVAKRERMSTSMLARCFVTGGLLNYSSKKSKREEKGL